MVLSMSVTDVLTAIGALLTGIGLIYTGIQVKLSRKTTRSQFLIQLFQLMEQHNEIHGRLTGLGWPDGRKGPDTVEEWIQVGRLLGLFEYIQILVQDGLLDLDTVDELYSYRLFHLWNNEVIRHRHFGDNRTWTGVVKLLGELKHRRMFMLLSEKYGTQLDRIDSLAQPNNT
jgi:hypothetical protein